MIKIKSNLLAHCSVKDLTWWVTTRANFQQLYIANFQQLYIAVKFNFDAQKPCSSNMKTRMSFCSFWKEQLNLHSCNYAYYAKQLMPNCKNLPVPVVGRSIAGFGHGDY